MKKGFTLAEVLITLVVLGIVAAMTIPAVSGTTRETEYRSKAKKVYSILTQAMAFSSLQGYQPTISVTYNSDEDIQKWFDLYLAKHLNVIKSCKNAPGCWNSGDTYYLKGGTVKYNKTGVGIGNSIYTVVLSDGTFLNVDSYYYENTKEFFGVDIPKKTSSLVVFFDVNGDKKPNTLGKDIYVAVYDGETLVPPFRDYPELVENECSKKGYGYSCLYKIVDKSFQ